MLCVNTELGVRFVVQLLLLSPVLSPVLWSFLYNIEVAFMFSVLFLVFWNKIASRCAAPRPPMTDVGTETAFRLDQRKHFRKSKHLFRSEVS